MNKKEKKALAACAVERLKQIYPDAECALHWGGGEENAWMMIILLNLLIFKKYFYVYVL